MQKFDLIGSAFGKGAQIQETSQGPIYMRDNCDPINCCEWKVMITQDDSPETKNSMGRNYQSVLDHNKKLSASVSDSIKKGAFPIVIGGDHSCGIGTWSGVTSALNAESKFGLIWFDAHLDTHTIATSPSKAHHGMPISSLLGVGDKALGSIGSDKNKISKDHLVYIGIRSYEPEEKALLDSLGVRIIYMDELLKIGMKNAMQEAHAIISNGTEGYGISIDLDFFDPKFAPGVGSPEPNGANPDEFIENASILFADPNMKALEITELNPQRDMSGKTSTITRDIIQKLVESRV